MTEAESATRPTRDGGRRGQPVRTAVTGRHCHGPGRTRRPSRSSGRPTPVGPPPRRPAHRRLVGWIALAVGLVGIAALAGGLGFEIYQQRQADADQARDQRFVDTATQTVVNMFSYKQDNIDQSVARFVDGTSGPLRGMLSSNNNVENIKALFRHTDASSEAVINGAALEGIDSVTDNASVLVSVRVTVTDLDGVNKPSDALPDAGHRARGRQRADDRLRPEVSRRRQLMRWLIAAVVSLLTTAFVGLAAAGGWFYWERVRDPR